MTEYVVDNGEWDRLQGKVVLVTGGSTGIGRSIVEFAHSHGAKVAFCDVNEDQGRVLENELGSDIYFEKTDVARWSDVVAFFNHAYERFGCIDTVISNAAINKIETLEPLPDEAELQEPDVSVLTVNTIGTWFVTKCALHFFNKHPDTPSQLVLFGSVASFFDTPPLYTYCTSKAAVLGLMRALRTQLPKQNVTVNLIAPWLTVTSMVTDAIKEVWGDLPANQPVDVAKAALLPAVQPEVNGKSFLVNGGKITEVEDGLDRCQAMWLGPQLDEAMREGQRRLIP